MLNRFFNFKLCLLCAVSCVPLAAMAGQECKKPPFEMVTTLFHPNPGAYSVWTGILGEPKIDENYYSAVPLAGGAVLVVGEERENPEAAPVLLLTQLDERGRKKWSVKEKIDGLVGVKKILRLEEDRFMVLMNVVSKDGQGKILLGFYDKAGVKINHLYIEEGRAHFEAEDIVMSFDGKKMFLAVVKNEKKSSDMKNQSGVFVLDTKGFVINKRFFIMGNGSVLRSVSSVKISEKEDGVIATGWYENDYKKKIGWGLLLNTDGELVWQREFERGLSASIEKSAFYNNQSILVFGEVVPADSGSIGAWVMNLSLSDGHVLWQRYYEGETGAHDYRPRGVLVNKDGLIILAMQAKTDQARKQAEKMEREPEAKKEDVMRGDLRIPDFMDYVHVLTLDPRGVTLSGDSYFEGLGMELSQMELGVKGERVLIGSVVRKDGDIPMLLKSAEKSGDELAVEKDDMGEKPKLPEVVLSEKTLKGLALLGGKIKGDNKAEKQADSGESGNSAKLANEIKDDGKSYDGGVVMATAPEAYTDPCVSVVKSLNSQ